MRQIFGYLVGLLGLIVLALSFDPIKKAVNITLPGSLTATVLTAAGLILIGISLVMLFKMSGSKKVSEVPIYKGKDVVGFRRLEK